MWFRKNTDAPASNWVGCQRCRSKRNTHTVNYPDGSGGVGALCEQCWGKLTPVVRLHYHVDLMKSWELDGPVTRSQMENVVFAVINDNTLPFRPPSLEEP